MIRTQSHLEHCSRVFWISCEFKRSGILYIRAAGIKTAFAYVQLFLFFSNMAIVFRKPGYSLLVRKSSIKTKQLNMLNHWKQEEILQNQKSFLKID